MTAKDFEADAKAWLKQELWLGRIETARKSLAALLDDVAEKERQGIADSRESLAQEIRQGLRQRGHWAPERSSDLISAVFKALEDVAAKADAAGRAAGIRECVSVVEFRSGVYRKVAELASSQKIRTLHFKKSVEMANLAANLRQAMDAAWRWTGKTRKHKFPGDHPQHGNEPARFFASKPAEPLTDDGMAELKRIDANLRDKSAPVETPAYGQRRCEVCGWPLVDETRIGCVPGSCSYRPELGSDEYRRIERRRHELGADRQCSLPQPAEPARPTAEREPSEWTLDTRRRGELTRDIARAINRVSAENGSNTPDFILAEMLVDVLGAFDRAVNAREKWNGHDAAPVNHPEIPVSSPPAEPKRQLAEGWFNLVATGRQYDGAMPWCCSNVNDVPGHARYQVARYGRYALSGNWSGACESCAESAGVFAAPAEAPVCRECRMRGDHKMDCSRRETGDGAAPACNCMFWSNGGHSFTCPANPAKDGAQ